MGDVLITYKIMPNGVDADLEGMKSEIIEKVKTIGKIVNFEIQPIAFGLKALILKIVVKDEGGITDKLEDVLSSVKDVQGVVAEEVTLI